MVNLTNKTSNDLLTAGLQDFESEDELYQYLEKLSTADDGESFFDKAKAAVNAWWVRAIVGIANADKFYGFNSAAGCGLGRTYEAPERLKKWLLDNGLDTKAKVFKARAASKAWLSVSESYTCVELLTKASVSTLKTAGGAHESVRADFVEQAVNGVTASVLEKAVADSNKSTEILQKRLVEAERVAEERLLKFQNFSGTKTIKGVDTPEYKQVRSLKSAAKSTVDTLREQLQEAAVISHVATDWRTSDPALKALEQQLEEANKQAEQARKEAEQARAEAAEAKAKATQPPYSPISQAVLQKLNSVLPGGMSSKKLEDKLSFAADRIKAQKEALEEAEDPKTVTPINLQHRVDLVNTFGCTWEEMAVTYEKARELCTDPYEIIRAEKSIIAAWKSWIDHLRPDKLEELNKFLQIRLQEIEATDQTHLVTIDV